MAGSLAAAMLGRAGIDAVLVDPHPVYPPDFRCEKLDRVQLRDAAADRPRRCGAARLDARPRDAGWRASADWSTRCRAHRSAASSTTRWSTPCGRKSRPHRVHPGQGHRHLDRRRTGRPSSFRTATRFPRASSSWPPASTSACCHKLGHRRARSSAPAIRSRSASTSQPVGRPAFPFSALTYFPERPADRAAYITLFPIGAAMRANLFVYRDLHDPWLKQFREAPAETLSCACGPACAS